MGVEEIKVSKVQEMWCVSPISNTQQEWENWCELEIDDRANIPWILEKEAIGRTISEETVACMKLRAQKSNQLLDLR